MPAITDFTSLQEAALQWIGRDDDPNDDVRRNIGTMVTLAETKLRPRLKGIRILKTRAKALLDEEWEWLPSNFAHMSSVSVLPANDEAREYPLSYKGEQQFIAERLRLVSTTAPACVTMFTTIGRQIRFGPWHGDPGDATMFRIIYYARPVPLSDSNPTNELLAEHPEIYLYATLVETAPYISDDGRINVWRGALDDAIDMASENDNARGTMAQSPGGWRP